MCLIRDLKISPGLEPIDAEENTDDMEKILTASYLRQVKTKLDMLKAIGDANTLIQTHVYKYAQGRDVIYLLIREVRENKGDRDHVLHGCKLGTKYIKADNHLYTDHQFAKGVYKIQSGIENKIFPSGKWACVRLQKTENNGQYGCDIDDSTKSLFSTKKIKNSNKRKLEARDLGKSAYICCDFIAASDVIVDQLCSKAYALKTKRRKGMSPIFLVLIIYIKENSHIRNKMDVVLAYRTAMEDMIARTKEKVSEDEEAYRVEEAQ